MKDSNNIIAGKHSHENYSDEILKPLIAAKHLNYIIAVTYLIKPNNCSETFKPYNSGKLFKPHNSGEKFKPYNSGETFKPYNI